MWFDIRSYDFKSLGFVKVILGTQKLPVIFYNLNHITYVWFKHMTQSVTVYNVNFIIGYWFKIPMIQVKYEWN